MLKHFSLFHIVTVLVGKAVWIELAFYRRNLKGMRDGLSLWTWHAERSYLWRYELVKLKNITSLNLSNSDWATFCLLDKSWSVSGTKCFQYRRQEFYLLASGTVLEMLYFVLHIPISYQKRQKYNSFPELDSPRKKIYIRYFIYILKCRLLWWKIYYLLRFVSYV